MSMTWSDALIIAQLFTFIGALSTLVFRRGAYEQKNSSKLDEMTHAQDCLMRKQDNLTNTVNSTAVKVAKMEGKLESVGEGLTDVRHRLSDIEDRVSRSREE